MAVTLEDAVIRVKLDVEGAKRELDEEERKKDDRKDPGGKGKGGGKGGGKEAGFLAIGGAAGRRFGRGVGRKALGAAKAASALAAITLFSEAQILTAGTTIATVGGIVALSNPAAGARIALEGGKLIALAALLPRLIAEAKAAADTLTQARDFARGKRLLGDPTTGEDLLDFTKILVEVNRAQARMQFDLDRVNKQLTGEAVIDLVKDAIKVN